MNGLILTPDRRIRVFLSSRLVEFAAERMALVKMIQKMGLTPLFFEEVPSHHPPRDLYSAFVAQSDIFLGIYGTGYGWIDEPAGMTISGLHDEWMLSARKPRIVFVQETAEPREPRLEKLLAEIGGAGVSFNRFRTRAELLKRARDAIALCVSERFLAAETLSDAPPQDYAAQLATDLEKLPVLHTEFFTKEVQPSVASHRRIFIAGSFGAGKSSILYLLSRAAKSVYLSLRQQSLLGALGHICDHLSAMVGEPRRRLLSVEEARPACDGLLRRVEATILIDDVDQAPDIATGLAALAEGSSRFVFAGRSVPKHFGDDLRVLRCPGFTRTEAEEYVSRALPVAPVTAQVAVERSAGNPLYLRYYLQSAPGTAEPAKSVDEYHTAMWVSITARQKELISVLSLSEVALTFVQLGRVLSKYRGSEVSGIAAMDETAGIAHLLSTGERSAQIFHPAFREFVFREITRADLARDIHRYLAATFTSKADRALRVIHLARAGLARKVYRDLLSVAHWSEVTGRTALARELIASALRVARTKRDWFILGLGLHQSANLKQHTRSMSSALLSSRLSEQMFLRSKRAGVSLIARSARGVFLLELNRGDEAEVILREVAEEYRQAGAIASEALVRVNLAFVLVRRGRMAECAEQCHLAIALFERTGDSYGIAISVLNLQNYYIAMSDTGKQIGCIRRLKALSRELESPRLEVAAYNGLTIVYRRAGKYPKAEKACLKGIALAQMLGLWDVETSNIGNLGNVYRDQKRYDKARQCYESVLRRAEEKRSTHHIAWGKELIATIIEREGDVAASAIVGEESAVLWREIGDVHREATTEADQARRFHKMGDHAAAARASENAAWAWHACGVFHEARDYFVRAVGKWMEAGADTEAARAFDAGWVALAPAHANERSRLLSDLPTDATRLAPLLDTAALLTALPTTLASTSMRSLARDAVGVVSAIFRAKSPQNRLYECLARALAAQFISDHGEGSALALAFAIEQAPAELFVGDAFREICAPICDVSEGLIYRCDRLVGERWIVIFPAERTPAIEIVADQDFPGIRAAAAMCALMLWAKRAWFAEKLDPWGWPRLGLCLFAIAAEECEARGMQLPDYLSKDVVGVMAKLYDLSDPHPEPIPLIIRGDFLDCVNEASRPDNRSALGLMMQVGEGVIENFSHGKVPRDQIRELRFQFVSEVFGVRRKEDEDTNSSDTSDDADDLI